MAIIVDLNAIHIITLARWETTFNLIVYSVSYPTEASSMTKREFHQTMSTLKDGSGYCFTLFYNHSRRLWRLLVLLS